MRCDIFFVKKLRDSRGCDCDSASVEINVNGGYLGGVKKKVKLTILFFGPLEKRLSELLSFLLLKIWTNFEKAPTSKCLFI